MKSDLLTNANVIAQVKEKEVVAGSLAAEIILGHFLHFISL